MNRTFILSSLTALGLAVSSHAEVYVRAPFVRVNASPPGVQVRAPLVKVAVPNPAPPLVVFQEPPPVPVPQPGVIPLPQPTPVRAMTIQEFAQCFKGGCGTYEAVLINPCTCQPCLVRFCLPDCPRRVTCQRHEIVFHYGLLKKVRIRFDCHGASVTSFCH